MVPEVWAGPIPNNSDILCSFKTFLTPGYWNNAFISDENTKVSSILVCPRYLATSVILAPLSINKEAQLCLKSCI